MAESLFSTVLTFSILAAGTIAMGSEMAPTRQPAPAAAATHVVMLPAVTVIGRRAPATEIVMLPAVTITAHRAPVALAYEPRSAEQPRAE